MRREISDILLPILMNCNQVDERLFSSSGVTLLPVSNYFTVGGGFLHIIVRALLCSRVISVCYGWHVCCWFYADTKYAKFCQTLREGGTENHGSFSERWPGCLVKPDAIPAFFVSGICSLALTASNRCLCSRGPGRHLVYFVHKEVIEEVLMRSNERLFSL